MTSPSDSVASAPIPQVFHHIWWQGADALPPRLRAWRQGWIDRHPHWQFILWDATTMQSFVNLHEPGYAADFAAWPQAIFRADAFRYMLLKHRGGVYLDLDIECLRPIDSWTDGCEVLLSRTMGYNNCVLGGRARHDLWGALVDALPRQAHSGDAYRGNHSGPAFLTNVVRRGAFDQRPECRLAPPQIFEPLSPCRDADGQFRATGQTAETCAIHRERLDWMPWHRRALSRLTGWTVMPALRFVMNLRTRRRE